MLSIMLIQCSAVMAIMLEILGNASIMLICCTHPLGGGGVMVDYPGVFLVLSLFVLQIVIVFGHWTCDCTVL